MLRSPAALAVGGCVRLCTDLMLGQYFLLNEELLDWNGAKKCEKFLKNFQSVCSLVFDLQYIFSFCSFTVRRFFWNVG